MNTIGVPATVKVLNESERGEALLVVAGIELPAAVDPSDSYAGEDQLPALTKADFFAILARLS